MIQRMLASALIAGVAVGLLAALLHFAFVQQVLLLGEEYETGAMVHFGGAGSKPAEAGHGHDAAEAAVEAAAPAAEAPAAEGDAHQHPAPAGGEDGGSDLARNGLTVLFTTLIYTAYALILVAGFQLAEAIGHRIGAVQGLLWGLGGYLAFQLAPAMGLAPELPGTIAAELGQRQVWWWLTVACTAGGLALLAYGRHWALFGLGGALLALPHVIGAPQPEGFWGIAPTELGALFSARVLGVGFVVWAMLGWVAGAVWAHEGQKA